MTPIEFTLWLNGALGIVPEGEAPSPEQFALIRDKLGAVMGHITAQRLLERAEEVVKQDELHRAKALEHAKLVELQKQLMEEQMAKMKGNSPLHPYIAPRPPHILYGLGQNTTSGDPMLEPGGVIMMQAGAPPKEKSGGLLSSLLRPAVKASGAG